MAFLYLRDHPFDEALARIRTGIQSLNRANGVAATGGSGDHETVTVAWARVIASAIANPEPPTDFESFAADHPHLLSRSLLRLHYTKEHIATPLARSSFVEPDLAPLPRHPSQGGRPLRNG